MPQVCKRWKVKRWKVGSCEDGKVCKGWKVRSVEKWKVRHWEDKKLRIEGKG